uniref:Cytochrome P450, family 4, subfamily T, polypeptide 8 n=1 Tax=Paramormyrops kingsleyae TaxID=1676925 RepID=A0A3B3RK94_9TELE
LNTDVLTTSRLVVLAKLLMKRREFVRVLQPFPGPPKHWLYGHVHEFPQDGTDLYKVVKWVETYPLAFPLWFGPSVAVLHGTMLKSDMTPTHPSSICFAGNGLLVSQGQKWFLHRRLLTPGFHYDILKHYVTLMAESARAMLDKWEVYADQDEPFELFNHVSLMTLDSIMQCAFSCRSNCQTER